MDVVKGLGVSVRGEWFGDEDRNDGVLNSLYQEYKHRLKTAAEIGLEEHGSPEAIECDLNSRLQELTEDLIFLHSGKLHAQVHVHTCTCIHYYCVLYV